MGNVLGKKSNHINQENEFKMDSFDDRVCDDLCEEILQYLSLEDKLRLQCVSKQFQKTVFRRQRELYFDASNQILLKCIRFTSCEQRPWT